MKPRLQDDPETELTHALEKQPAIDLPADFAARVVAALPAQRTSRYLRSRNRLVHMGVGRSIAIVAALALTFALFAIAPHIAPSFASFAFDVELLLVVQLVAIAWFLAPARKL